MMSSLAKEFQIESAQIITSSIHLVKVLQHYQFSTSQVVRWETNYSFQVAYSRHCLRNIAYIVIFLFPLDFHSRSTLASDKIFAFSWFVPGLYLNTAQVISRKQVLSPTFFERPCTGKQFLRFYVFMDLYFGVRRISEIIFCISSIWTSIQSWYLVLP